MLPRRNAMQTYIERCRLCPVRELDRLAYQQFIGGSPARSAYSKFTRGSSYATPVPPSQLSRKNCTSGMAHPWPRNSSARTRTNSPRRGAWRTVPA